MLDPLLKEATLSNRQILDHSLTTKNTTEDQANPKLTENESSVKSAVSSSRAQSIKSRLPVWLAHNSPSRGPLFLDRDTESTAYS